MAWPALSYTQLRNGARKTGLSEETKKNEASAQTRIPAVENEPRRVGCRPQKPGSCKNGTERISKFDRWPLVACSRAGNGFDGEDTA
jgi:hypothetical protein